MTHAHILPPKAFYLVRHGESEANLRRVAAGGRVDTPLTPLGISQAKELAEVIHALPQRPSRIYHSPQQRAHHTANYINDMLKLDMVMVDNLKEHIYGDWEHQSWDIVKPLMSQMMDPPNGETYADFGERIRSTLDTILSRPHDAPPMMVCHGGVFHAILHLYGMKKVSVGNCALHFYEPDLSRPSFPWKVTSFTPCAEQGGLRAEIQS